MKLNKKEIIILISFFRQAERCGDRASQVGWGAVKKYYTQDRIKEIEDYIKILHFPGLESFGFSGVTYDLKKVFSLKMRLKGIWRRFQWVFFGGVVIPSDELFFYKKIIDVFFFGLHAEADLDRCEIVELRLKLCVCYELLRLGVADRNLLRRIDYVEHFDFPRHFQSNTFGEIINSVEE